MTKNDLVIRGLRDYGLTEIPGLKNNPKIVDYFKQIGHGWVADDETAWCAAWLNAILMDCGFSHTGKLNARSFLSLGIETDKPEIGDIAVFWRENKNGALGHAGLYIGQDEHYIYVLGGNQNNAVNISKYSRGQLLGFRSLIIKC